MSEPQLNFRERGQGPALVILHGLFGSGRNWGSIARTMSSDFRVILPDLRNHGQSFHSAEHSYQLMAADLDRLLLNQGISQFHLLGHSMGGKVAMRYAFDFPDKLLNLIILDMAPKGYPSTQHTALLQSLQNLDLSSITSRDDADQALKELIPANSLRQFLLSNLQHRQTGWEWQINLPVLTQNLAHISGKLELPEQTFAGCPVHFIYGDRSDYVSIQDLALIQSYFPAASLDCLPNAGHWLHADQPQALTALLQHYLI